MTQQQTLDIVEKIKPNIAKLAYVFLSKMKQPSNLKHNDLVQEGVQMVLRQIKLGRYKEGMGASPETYFLRAVLTRYIDLMHKSYKEPISISSEIFSGFEDVSEGDDLRIPIDLEDLLSEEERRYAQCMILPPVDVRGRISKNRKATRKLIREFLKISRKEEFEIRKSIKKKLAGVEE